MRCKLHNYEKLLGKIRNNEVVLWVGAGFSKYAGVPTGGDLVKIILSHATPSEKEFLKNYNSLPEIADEFVKMRDDKKTDLLSIMKNALLTDVNVSDLNVHRSLKNIPQIQTIITTNFDVLFELAYGNEIEVIINDESIPAAFLSVNSDKVKLFKIHSDFTNPNLMIITKSDYIKFFDNDVIYRPLWTEIKSIIAKKSILFIGYSLEDSNFQFIFDKIIDKLGEYSNECFLVSPQLPEHKQIYFSKKGISYIPMSAEEIIPKLEKDVKEKLIEDCSKNLVDYLKVKKVFENDGIDLKFQICGSETYLSTIGVLDSDNRLFDMNVSITFEDNNKKEKYIETMKKLNDLLNGKSFEPITISGEFIKEINTKLNGYNIGTIKDDTTQLTHMLITPYPVEEYEGHLYFENVDEPESVIFKRYESNLLIQTEIIHKNFKIIFKFFLTKINDHQNIICDKKLFINYSKPSDIYEGLRISKLLLKWYNGEKVQFYRKKDYSFLFDLQDFNRENDILKEFVETLKFQEYIYSSLIKIQKYFEVKFENPDKIISSDIDLINKLNRMISNEGKLYIKQWTVSNEILKYLDLNDVNVIFELDIVSKEIETIILLGVELKLGYPHYYCKDAFIENGYSNQNEEKDSCVVIKSKSSNIYLEYKDQI